MLATVDGNANPRQQVRSTSTQLSCSGFQSLILLHPRPKSSGNVRQGITDRRVLPSFKLICTEFYPSTHSLVSNVVKRSFIQELSENLILRVSKSLNESSQFRTIRTLGPQGLQLVTDDFD
ncbi:MAG: hypothetical protein BWX88_05046 [Planctomycetes bacterium ADurb.Bin126]|nr:MAG: hypothetical protein BWX88_05046 [Planctomycetes bacterium ADurb.Bin126]